MVSHPELGLDPPIGSDWESGCDTFSELGMWEHMGHRSNSLLGYIDDSNHTNLLSI